MALSKNKRVLITGGGGFIGRNTVEYFRDKYTIFAPSHKQLNLLDTNKVYKFVINNNIDVIIHCATIDFKRHDINSENIFRDNLKIFFNVIRNAPHVKKIIHFGSGAEYDKGRNLTKVKETDFDQLVPVGEYGFYKYICSKYIEKSKRIICLRLFGIYGKYEDYKFKFISNAIVKNLLKQDIVINQNVIFDYLFIDDLMPIMDYFILNKAKFKIYNVTPDKSIDLITISNIINEISDYKSKIIILKDRLNNEYTADNSRLKNEIPNIKFRGYKEAIEKLFVYYKKNIRKLDKDSIIKDKYVKISPEL